jgi:hypothetical protein
MTGPSFRDAELEGWDRKASYWDDSMGTVTLGAIDPLLTALTQPLQFGWQSTQLNFIGNLRPSRATPAYAELPSTATRPSTAMCRVAALSNIQARVGVQRARMILTSAGYRIGLVALQRRACTGDSRSSPAASESNLSQG